MRKESWKEMLYFHTYLLIIIVSPCLFITFSFYCYNKYLSKPKTKEGVENSNGSIYLNHRDLGDLINDDFIHLKSTISDDEIFKDMNDANEILKDDINETITYESLKDKPIPSVGIIREGNLCYRVSMLQSILSYTDFIHKLCRLDYNKDTHAMCYHLKKFILEYWSKDDNDIIDPGDFMSFIDIQKSASHPFYTSEDPNQQQDFSEFLVAMLDQLRFELSKSSSNDECELFQYINREFFLFGEIKKYSRPASYLNPAYMSSEIFTMAHLAAQTDSLISKYLEGYFADEIVDSKEKSILSPSPKFIFKTEVKNLPKYLHICINQIAEYTIPKIEENIVFMNTNYELVSCVYRNGSDGYFGHFYISVKRNNQWIEFNDTSIKYVKPKLEDIYMLGYRKKRSQLFFKEN